MSRGGRGSDVRKDRSVAEEQQKIKEKREERSSGFLGSAVFLSGAIAAMCALFTVLLLTIGAAVGDPTALLSEDMMQILAMLSLPTGVIAYVGYVPGVLRRIVDAVLSPFSEQRTRDTGWGILTVELLGVVIMTVGGLSSASFIEECRRGGPCRSVADMLGWTAGDPLVGYVPLFVFYFGALILAAGWFGEGLEATEDRGEDDDRSAVSRFR